MKYKIRQYLRWMLLLAIVGLHTSCTKEDTSECNVALLLNVKAYVNSVEIGGENIKDITLYVFDQNSLFLEQINTNVNELVSLDYRDASHFNIVAVGNGKQGGQAMPTLSVGDHISTGLISIKQTRVVYPVYTTPDDLFMGMVESVVNVRRNNSEVIIVPIQRVMASVNITVKGLKEYYGAGDDNYHIVIRKTYSTFDFYGRGSGTEISHQPTGSFNAQERYVVPDFNILPLANNGAMVLDIYYGNVLITTVVNDSSGNKLVPKAGQLLNILVDFTAYVSVSIVTTPWGQAYLWKEWN